MYSGPRAPVLSAESAPTLAPAAAAPVHVCDCYTKCQGTCVNAPIEGPRKRGKKEEPLSFSLSVCVCVTSIQAPGRYAKLEKKVGKIIEV